MRLVIMGMGVATGECLPRCVVKSHEVESTLSRGVEVESEA